MSSASAFSSAVIVLPLSGGVSLRCPPIPCEVAQVVEILGRIEVDGQDHGFVGPERQFPLRVDRHQVVVIVVIEREFVGIDRIVQVGALCLAESERPMIRNDILRSQCPIVVNRGRAWLGLAGRGSARRGLGANGARGLGTTPAFSVFQRGQGRSTGENPS